MFNGCLTLSGIAVLLNDIETDRLWWDSNTIGYFYCDEVFRPVSGVEQPHLGLQGRLVASLQGFGLLFGG